MDANNYFAYQLHKPPMPWNPTGQPLRDEPGFLSKIFSVSCWWSRPCTFGDVAEDIEPGAWCGACLCATNCEACAPCHVKNVRKKFAARYLIPVPESEPMSIVCYCSENACSKCWCMHGLCFQYQIATVQMLAQTEHEEIGQLKLAIPAPVAATASV